MRRLQAEYNFAVASAQSAGKWRVRYEPSNPSEALARGRSATYKPNADGVNKAAIFRFNPGIKNKIFPPKAPYYKTKTKKEKKVVDRILNKELFFKAQKAIEENNKHFSKEFNIPLGKPMS